MSKFHISEEEWNCAVDSIAMLLDEVEELKAELQCFWTGNVPEGATLSQVILAQAGRKRLEKMKAKE